MSVGPSVIATRIGAQMLDRPPGHTPEDVVRRLLAVQAQDPRGLRLSIRSRAIGLTARDVDAALTERRSLLVTWLNRGTLHLVAAEDYWWLHPLTTPQLATGNARRLQQEGVDPGQADLGVQIVREAVASGPQTRSQLRDLLDAAGVPTARQALVHVLVAASLRGDVVRGPVVDGHHAFVSATAWLGPAPAALPRDEALGRLALRYLAAHGPADARDLARWAGITLGDARRGLGAVADVLRESEGGLVDLADREPSVSLPPPRLLGPFDPLLLGWTAREPIVGPHLGLVTDNGLFRPFALVDGRAVATWGLAGSTLTVRMLEHIGESALAALRADAHDVLAFLGLPDREPIVTSG